MLQNMFKIKELPKDLDATDGLAAAVCHHYQNRISGTEKSNYSGWSAFISKNPSRTKQKLKRHLIIVEMERFILNISNSTRMFDWKLNIKQKLNLYKMKNGLLTIAAILSSMALQLQAQNVLFEDFESGAMPAGWSQTTLANDGGYKFGINTVIQSASWPVVAHTKMVGT